MQEFYLPFWEGKKFLFPYMLPKSSECKSLVCYSPRGHPDAHVGHDVPVVCQVLHQSTGQTHAVVQGGSYIIVETILMGAGGRGFDPRPHHTKDVTKMVPDVPYLALSI